MVAIIPGPSHERKVPLLNVERVEPFRGCGAQTYLERGAVVRRSKIDHARRRPTLDNIPEQVRGLILAAIIDEDVKPIVRTKHVIEVVRQRHGIRHQNSLFVEKRDYDRYRKLSGGFRPGPDVSQHLYTRDSIGLLSIRAGTSLLP